MAVQDPTTNYSWDLPTNAGDSGAWGNKLRTILGDDATGVDAVVKAVSTVANAAMPKAGGTFTGEVKVLELNQTVVDKGPILSGAVSIDYSAGGFQHGTLSGTTTFTFTNPPASGTYGAFRFRLLNDGQTINWPAAVDWGTAGAPSFASGSTQTFEFWTIDGGSVWYGRTIHIT